MKTIKDTIHGNIVLNELEVSVLDTPEMQRLRNLKQLGFTYLVYPSATHTRFEHSLGSFYLADQAGKTLSLSEDECQKVRLAALLHDVGHGPFSHSSEDAIKTFTSKFTGHEDKTVELTQNGLISEILKEAGLNPKEISDISTGKKKPLGELVSGEIDVDRMDYLVRDSYYTGAAYGVIDLDRLTTMLAVEKDKVAVRESGLSAAEALVLARYLMYPTVYQHHAARVAHTMFSYAVSSCLKEDVFTADEVFCMDDIDLISKILNLENSASAMIRDVQNRNLYKRAAVFHKQDLKEFEKVVKMKPEAVNQLQTELAESAGLESGEVLVDLPRQMYVKEAQANVLTSNGIKELKEVSPLAKALSEAQWSYWNLAIYSKKENVEKVTEAAKKIIS